MKRDALGAMLAVVIGVGALFPVARARLTSQDEPIKLRTELVVLDAQVLRKKTSLAVGNLAREDFVLYEDGVKQHITHFSLDKLPLSVIILFDVSGSVASDRKSVQRLFQGAYEALKLLKREDEVALMQFAEKATLIQPFTRDRDLLVNALAKLDGRGQYGTYVAHGIREAANYMRSASNPDSRRAIIAITDDVTVELKRFGSSSNPTASEEGEALHELYESGSVLCTMLYGEPESGFVDPYFKRAVAHRFTEATGGITIKTSQQDIPSRLSEMIERLRQRYTVGYTPSNTGRDGKFRKIKLTVTPDVDKREGGVAVITRKGYYAK